MKTINRIERIQKDIKELNIKLSNRDISLEEYYDQHYILDEELATLDDEYAIFATY